MKKLCTLLLALALLLVGCGGEPAESSDPVPVRDPDDFTYEAVTDATGQRLEVHDGDSLVQILDYATAETVTKEPYYVEDATFTGVPCLLLPARYNPKTADTYFTAYRWDGTMGQFVEMPSFRQIPNPVLSKEENRVLSYSFTAATEVTAYVKYAYTDGAFTEAASLRWHPVEEEGSVELTEVRDGKTTTQRCPLSPGAMYDLHWDDPLTEPYLEQYGFWSVNSQRWEDYFYTSAEFLAADSLLLETVDRSAVEQTFTGSYQGKPVTVSAARFTGIPILSLWSYKRDYSCRDGLFEFEVASTVDGRYRLVDKAGVTVGKLAVKRSYPSAGLYSYHRWKDSQDTYAAEPDKDTSLCGLLSPEGERVTSAIYAYFYVTETYAVGLLPDDGGAVIFNRYGKELGRTDMSAIPLNDTTVTLCTGELGDYRYRLGNLQGKAVSEEFDHIGGFYNGFALVTRDRKVGLLAITGETVLVPCIPYDRMVYPPKPKYFFLTR